MRILFATQSSSLRVFEALRAAMANDAPIERAGFTVADSFYYDGFLREHAGFESSGHLILKEWEVTARRQGTPDLSVLARFERELGGDAGLFGAIVADRRLFMGPDCTSTQDYRRRFTDDELLCILQAGLESTERLFDELRPDVVVSFICVTMLEYLVHLFARARGVRVLNLRPMKIGDRVGYGSVLNDPSPELSAAYRRARTSDSPRLEDARAHIRRVRERDGRYEGVVRPSAAPAQVVNRRRQAPWAAALRVASNYRRYRRSTARSDNHVADPLRALIFSAVWNPMRARRTRQLLANRYISGEALRRTRYAFFPLHTEPEVSLLVYGRPFLNQIELIRQIALSLPIDMVLVLKEHPWMVGKRTSGAYRKLLNIPRVHIARPDTEARDLLAHAALITVITSSVAFEAAILGKPVITFGECPYNLLPPPMVRRCHDLRDLPSLARTMTEEFANDEPALERFIAAMMEESESVNLYSVLLSKPGVHAERKGAFGDEIEKLARYTLARLRQPASLPIDAAAATW